MANSTIDLDLHQWTVGAPLVGGVGGFGQVFDVVDENGRAGVGKFVPQAPGSQRELLMGDSLAAAGTEGVIPIWDTGEDEGRWVIVMPKAETSLQAHIETAGALPVGEAVSVLADVAEALAALAAMNPAIVHRDLKPANILRYEGRWCLADFGIAKYAEATTALDTMKFSMSRPYAAPEQWRFETATPATDVYAFGVVAYQLMMGEWPFPGPDFRQQHLAEVAPSLAGGTPRLRTLIEECLYKAAAARPSAANVAARLMSAGDPPATPGAARLAQANSAESDRRARDYAEALRQAEATKDNEAMFAVAEQSFESIWTSLATTIEAEAPTAVVDKAPAGARGSVTFTAQLGRGKIGVGRPAQVDKWSGPFRVVASSFITVNQPQNSHGYEGRSHSLWFCDAHEEGRFAWYELAFMDSPFSRGMRSVNPHSLSPEQAAVAFSNVMGTAQLGWPVEELDRADVSEFVDRWLGWFADASLGLLHYPSHMPEKSTQGTYRQS